MLFSFLRYYMYGSFLVKQFACMHERMGPPKNYILILLKRVKEVGNAKLRESD